MEKLKTGKFTQRDRILALLKNRGEVGVPVWELICPQPRGCGVAQYGSRILELRRKGFVIENKDSIFRLISEPKPEQRSFI